MTNEFGELEKFIGRRMTLEDLVTASQVQKMNATLNRSAPMPKAGESIPPGWHYLFFPKFPLTSELGRDGMVPEMDNGPEDPLPLRMFAGSRTNFYRPLRIGDEATQVTELTSLKPTVSRTGKKLVFITYRHTISNADGIATEDEWDIVFLEEDKDGGRQAPPGQSGPASATWEREITVTTTMLFRFSAAIWNPHRIHYDYPYTTETEGFPGLVVHGPLTFMWLLELARDSLPGATMTSFEMKAKSPLYADQPIKLMGEPGNDGKSCDLWAVNHEGIISTEASATFA
jgi:3-methylfumaryl-CoA hydratase